jgi:16S rRNA (guanine527-N7)-methyltransferase
MIEDRILKDYLKSLNLSSGPTNIKKVKSYLDLIYENNRYLNLVGTKKKNDILIRHIFDCLSMFEYLKKVQDFELSNSKILDIGTGAGLPGILLALFLKNSMVYLLDSRKKTGNFLIRTLKELDIKNAEVIIGRAEILSHRESLREKFDLVVARAVANLGILSELTIPFCKIGGRIILYKSKKLKDELSAAEKTISILGGKVADIVRVEIPMLEEYRVLLIIKKEEITLYKYPRKYVRMLKIPPDY